MAILPLRAQSPGATVISGTVYDSLAGAPLGGATVQLIDREGARRLVRTSLSDAQGQFTLPEVAAGRYALGFMHPLLDSLGLEPPVREVVVAGNEWMRVTLAVPSATQLRAAVCGSAGDTTQALLMGLVRDARDGSPLHGAVVDGLWLEYELRRREITRRLSGVADTTAANGWFALCDVPRGGTLSVRAARGGDSTAFIDVDVPAGGFVRRDLHIGAARTTIVRMEPVGLPPGADADTAAGAIQLHVGDGRLSGTVVGEDGRGALAGARVGIVGGPQVRAGPDGSWVLAGIPTGTRVLEVRAVGHYPRRIPVDVVAGAGPVQIALTTFRAVLDTVRVTASRFRLDATGFDRRRRMGMGRFLDPEDLLRRNAFFTTEVFNTVSGVRVDRVGPFGEKQLTMRSIGVGRCRPAFFVDGTWMMGLGAEEIDSFVHPEDIAGVEIYSSTFVPGEFQPELNGCGSIVIWTKPSSSPVRHWSHRRRALHGLAAVLIGIGTGTLITRM